MLVTLRYSNNATLTRWKYAAICTIMSYCISHFCLQANGSKQACTWGACCASQAIWRWYPAAWLLNTPLLSTSLQCCVRSTFQADTHSRLDRTMRPASCLTFARTSRLECTLMTTSSVASRPSHSPRAAVSCLAAMMISTATSGTLWSRIALVSRFCRNFIKITSRTSQTRNAICKKQSMSLLGKWRLCPNSNWRKISEFSMTLIENRKKGVGSGINIWKQLDDYDLTWLVVIYYLGIQMVLSSIQELDRARVFFVSSLICHVVIVRCAGRSRQPRELSWRDWGRNGHCHRVVGQRPQDLELSSPVGEQAPAASGCRPCVSMHVHSSPANVCFCITILARRSVGRLV